MVGDASLRGQQFTKQGRKSEGTAWRDNGKPVGVLYRRTKRDKVNSEAHLAVLPSNLATRQCNVKKLGRLACTVPCYLRRDWLDDEAKNQPQIYVGMVNTFETRIRCCREKGSSRATLRQRFATSDV